MGANRVAAMVPLLIASCAIGQIVLRDAPRRNPADEPPRWLGKTGVATAANRRVIVDRTLHAIEASDVQFAPGQIRYRDERGRVAQMDSGDVLMLLPAAPAQVSGAGSVKGIEWRELTDAEAGPQGRVELVDGEVIPGRLVEGVAKADSIAWEHSLLGKLDLPIESISRVVVRAGGENTKAKQASGGHDDVVVFTNGDVAHGVLDSIVAQGDSGTLSMSVDRKTMTTPLDRVASVTLANPGKPAQGVVVWLRDGTVIAGKTAEFGPPVLTLGEGDLVSGAGQTVQVPWGDVVGVNMNASSVVPLSRLAMVEVKAGEGRQWAVPPKVEASGKAAGGVGEVELSGPIEVSWTLPEGVRLVSMSAMMPESARALGDCVLVVSCGGQSVRQRLNGQQPIADVRLTPGDEATPTLKVSVESGEGGTIQDRVVLRRGLILVK